MHLRFSFKSDLSHQLDDKLGEENELDTYMSREVPVLEVNEPQSLTQEELDQGQEDHC